MSIIAALGTAAAQQALSITIDQLKGLLLGGRSCIIQVNNRTDRVLRRGNHGHSSGGWASGGGPNIPDHEIPRNSASVFGSESSGFATGAIGFVVYNSDRFDVVVNWANPFIGDNHGEIYIVGTQSLLFSTDKSVGVANEDAHFVYEFKPGFVQANWRWCNKCQGLFFGGNQTLGVCPAGGAHDLAGSGNYAVLHNALNVHFQENWRWCNKCQGLFFGGSQTLGVCPAGGAHDLAGSGNYAIAHNYPTGNQDNWRWCRKCQGLHFAGEPNNPSFGPCPASGAHELTDSGNYNLVQA